MECGRGESELVPVVSAGGVRARILLGVCGSVAAIKAPQLVRELRLLGDVRVVTTEHAEHFFAEKELPEASEVLRDADEWAQWQRMGDPVLHIELRRWADCFVVAPLDANTLAKISCGLCDNLLSCVARCWDFSNASSFPTFLVAPAMNTMMWNHPITSQQLATIKQWGIKVIPPISKKLACGDVGDGALANPHTIVEEVRAALMLNPKFALPGV